MLRNFTIFNTLIALDLEGGFSFCWVNVVVPILSPSTQRRARLRHRIHVGKERSERPRLLRTRRF